ncbi:VCBS repeat-containing protein [Corallococcus sp. M34]|uniref:VCBS repeat-containing protein n=1 Tax=Citreicoccus inhibens TaxID=2849499 RepID=UPI001C22A69D|nr:VCBS repeat-containing protein [Citreicoccus inhibens]MBU8898321.1 VCBS repeat-containing protein [Citreicoccus inhibens]
MRRKQFLTAGASSHTRRASLKNDVGENVNRHKVVLFLLGLLVAVPVTSQAQSDDWEALITPATFRQGHYDPAKPLVAPRGVYVAPYSINAGELPSIYVQSPEAFRLRIYRLGWYGGAGALVVYDSSNAPSTTYGPIAQPRCGIATPTTVTGYQALRQQETDYGLVECAWTQPVRPPVSALTSGLYFVRITPEIPSPNPSPDEPIKETLATFVVRNDASTERLVIVNPTTNEVYNPWGETLYTSTTCEAWPKCPRLSMYSTPRATKVSMARPSWNIPDHFKTDVPLLRFLEMNNLPYSVATDYDVSRFPSLMAARRSAIISGHGEYWDMATRNSLDAFVARGGNLIAMAANTGYWQIRYEASTTGNPGPIIVGYKQSATDTATPTTACRSDILVPAAAPNCSDPLLSVSPQLTTTYFRAPPVNKPEQELLGVQYPIDPAGNTFELPLTFFTNTVAARPSLGSGITAAGDVVIGPTLPSSTERVGILGWEADSIHPNLLFRMSPTGCLLPLGQGRFSDAPSWASQFPTPYGNEFTHLVMYRPSATSGHVVAGMSMLWSWGLDDWSTLRNLGGPLISRVDSRLQQFTRNLLASSDGAGFGTDCDKGADFDVFFGDAFTDTKPDGSALPGGDGSPVEMIIKEREYPGRWGSVAIAKQSGDVKLVPTFTEVAKLTGWAVVSDAYNLFLVDVNNDGRKDLVAQSRVNGEWDVALSDGTRFVPTGSPWLAATPGWAVGSDYDVFAADLNADGKADLVAKRRTSPGTWEVAFNTGTQFVPVTGDWLSGWAVVSSAYDLFVADVDGDGRADLIAKEKNSPGNWYVARNTGTGFLAQPTALSNWAVSSADHDLFVADVNGDHRADLIAKERTGDKNWKVALSTGLEFQAQTTPWLSGWAVNSSDFRLFVADVDGDGKADLIARERTSLGRWYAALSNGSSFVAQVARFDAR